MLNLRKGLAQYIKRAKIETGMGIDRQIADRIGYRLVSKIAEGGMGVVYKAHQMGVGEFRKLVAIKLIKERYSAVPEFQSNFVGEARLVADLIHTNIVQTYHLGCVNGQYFMVMEYVNGVNLEEFLIRHEELDRQVPVEVAVFIISRICRGLAYAHSKVDALGQPLGVVHRDVNPRNVMIAHEGDVKLTDFGIAKAAKLMYNKEGEVIAGKDGYLSPEQARREVTDGRADLFSCGILLVELLLGANPFDCDDGEESRHRICELPLPDFRELRPDIDERLNAILLRALARPREERYQAAGEMLTALELYLYSDGYGPTNEKLALYMHELMRGAPHAGTPLPARHSLGAG